MEINYPVFIRESTGYMDILRGDSKIDCLEEIDIDNDEYTAWDAIGRPLELYAENTDGRARYTNEEARPNEVKESIIAYVDQFKIDVPFNYSGDENNLEEFFDFAMDFIETNRKAVSFFDRTGSLFKRKST